MDVLRSAVWLVLLLAQARLKVLARLWRDDLLLREGQAGLFSGRQGTSSVSQADVTGSNRTVGRWVQSGTALGLVKSGSGLVVHQRVCPAYEKRVATSQSSRKT